MEILINRFWELGGGVFGFIFFFIWGVWLGNWGCFVVVLLVGFLVGCRGCEFNFCFLEECSLVVLVFFVLVRDLFGLVGIFVCLV